MNILANVVALGLALAPGNPLFDKVSVELGRVPVEQLPADVTAPALTPGVSLGIAATPPAAIVSLDVAAPSPIPGVSLSLGPPALEWALAQNVTAPAMTPGVSLSLPSARLFQGFLHPDIVHLLSAPMREQAEKTIAQFVELTEVDWPSGTMRVAQMPYSSLDRGHYSDKVRSYGQIQTTPSDRSGALGTTETIIELDDTDREISSLVESADAHQLVGSAVRRYLAHPKVDPADWFTLFSGVITKEPDFPSEGVSTLTARMDDAVLEVLAPRSGWTIDRTSWPNAHPDVITKSAPRVYSTHDCSLFQTSPGFLPGLLLDTQAFIYGFAAGRMMGIDDIFVDDVLTASGWTQRYMADRRGRIWTVVQFDADQGDAVITANGRGYEDVGDGVSGSLIEAPADILSHLLSNFHFGDWQRGSTWLPTNGLLGASLTSAAGVVKTFLADRVPTAAPYYGEQLAANDVIREFCDNHGLRVFWQAGQLGFTVEDVSVPPYSGDPLDGNQRVFTLGIGKDDIAVSPEVQVDLLPSAAQEKFLASFAVQLPDATGAESDRISLRWSDAS